nr:DUF6580 family putative transport protein [Candidatus Brachybacter algidus]
MSRKQIYIQSAVVIFMIVLAAASRLIPHTYNLTPVGAIALFGGAYLGRNWKAFLIPIMAIYLSDFILNNLIYAQPGDAFAYAYDGWYWVYGSYALIVLLGAFLLKKVSVLKVVAGSLGASAIFFLVSNFGCWPGTVPPVYTPDMNGLMQCYIAGLPFLKGTLVGDMVFSAALFGTYALIHSKVLHLNSTKEAASLS